MTVTSRAQSGTVLFRVAAGPRVGFGHLVRSCALAREMGADCLFSVRGTPQARAAARRLGARLVPGERPAAVLRSAAPALLVIDDRVARATVPWRRAARRARVPIASVHDLGIGLGDADLVVDGSVRPPDDLAMPARLGPAYAVLRALPGRPRTSADAVPRRVLVALGGGPRRTLAHALARSIAGRFPEVRVGVAGGFLAAGAAAGRIDAVAPGAFDAALAAADIAVVAGGLTLYEACSLGIPCVGVAVAASQRPTVAAFASRGAALDGGLVIGRPGAAVGAVTDAVEELLTDRTLRRRLARCGRRLVDGRGASRVAAALRGLMAASPAAGGRR